LLSYYILLFTMNDYWKNKKVLVTGGAGFIGSHVVDLLLQKKAEVSVITKTGNIEKISHHKKRIRIYKADLTDYIQAKRASRNQDIILNLASKVAGIQYNIVHPAIMFEDNVRIAQNMIKAAYENGTDRFLIVSSACIYPRNTSIPTPESEGFIGDPEPSNLGYGWAKRTAELLGRFYNSEFGMKVAIARPYNAYGPRDNFNPEISHVIPGIIKRVFDGENPLVVWGSGKQTRSFLYSRDFARGLLLTAEKYPVADPVNIGSDEEIPIGDLVKLILKLTGSKIKIKFDTSKPDGQPRRSCDTKKATAKIGFTTETPLKEGLKETIEWYRQHLSS